MQSSKTLNLISKFYWIWNILVYPRTDPETQMPIGRPLNGRLLTIQAGENFTISYVSFSRLQRHGADFGLYF